MSPIIKTTELSLEELAQLLEVKQSEKRDKIETLLVLAEKVLGASTLNPTS